MAIVREQYKVGQGGPLAAAQVTFDSAVKAGSLLLCLGSFWDSSGGVTFTVSDSQGNSWTDLYEVEYVAWNDQALLSYAMNANAGATTVTVTPSAGNIYFTVVIVEVSGILTTGAKDQNNAADSSGSSWDSGNITTTQNDEYLIGLLADDLTQTLTEDGAWTLIFEEEDASGQLSISVGERIVSSTLTESYSGTIGASTDYFAAIVSFKAAAAGGYTLTADYGSYALTGQAAGLVAARQLAAAYGSYTLTGQAAGLVAARVLAAAYGSYALTGQAAALRRGFTLAAAYGGYTLTGQAAGLVAARVLAAAYGSYALTGQAAALSYSGLTWLWMLVTLTGRGPAATLTGRGPAATLTGRGPAATFTVVE